MMWFEGVFVDRATSPAACMLYFGAAGVFSAQEAGPWVALEGVPETVCGRRSANVIVMVELG